MNDFGDMILREGEITFVSINDSIFKGPGERRDRYSHPYSYDPIRLWGDEKAEASSSAYTDRLMQWDSDKYSLLSKKHFTRGHPSWGAEHAKEIEAFLQDYIDDKTLKLVSITEFCNVSSGYPVWLLRWKTED